MEYLLKKGADVLLYHNFRIQTAKPNLKVKIFKT